ncbi:hypothetical protein [Nocardia salmonicida]|uniref:hypothetical protein n=1 Tax=Nocardia salmonicida TaxID=53431 RepID=UPI001470CBD5|nr:hypothetical protein [Nocardia salmonicida]MBC7299792.1 hypothetical protein [Nocardia sp.]
MTSPARSLSRLSMAELRKLAFEHRPDAHGHRCRRCGLAYGPRSGRRKECPTLREIRRELGIRSLSVTVTAAAAQGVAVCKGQAELWTVDRNCVAEWELAVAACNACPMLAACRKTLDQQIADGQAPPSMIVAGKLLDAAGEVVDDFQAHGRRRNAFAGRLTERTSKYRRQSTAVA